MQNEDQAAGHTQKAQKSLKSPRNSAKVSYTRKRFLRPQARSQKCGLERGSRNGGTDGGGSGEGVSPCPVGVGSEWYILMHSGGRLDQL